MERLTKKRKEKEKERGTIIMTLCVSCNVSVSTEYDVQSTRHGKSDQADQALQHNTEGAVHTSDIAPH